MRHDFEKSRGESRKARKETRKPFYRGAQPCAADVGWHDAVNLTGDESTIQPTTGNGIVNSANGVVTIKNLKTATINGQDKAVL